MSEPHEYVDGPTGRCDAPSTPAGLPCGRGRAADVHMAAAAEAPAAVRRNAKTWDEMPIPARIVILVVGAAMAVLFLTAVAGLSGWFLRLGGWL